MWKKRAPRGGEAAGDEGAVGGLHDIGQSGEIGFMACGKGPHAREDLGLACRRGHLEGVALETGGVTHTQRALREQFDDLLGERVDALAQRGQCRRKLDIVRVLEAAHRGRVGGGCGGVGGSGKKKRAPAPGGGGATRVR